jgi:tetratricopeptide (TPR) repeat protein
MRKYGDEWGLSFALNNLGEVARVRGDYALARTYYVESEALLRSSRDQGDLARLIHSLGYVALHEGDYEQAEARFRESLVMFRKLGNKRGIAECLAGLAGLGVRQGRAQWGAGLLAAAQARLRASHASWWPADRGEVERNRAAIRAALGEAEFEAAWLAGEKMSLEQAIAYASNGNRKTP